MAIDAFFCAVVFLRFAIQWLSRAFELLRQFYCLAGILFQSFGGPLLPFQVFSWKRCKVVLFWLWRRDPGA